MNEFCTQEMHGYHLTALSFPNIRKLMLIACLEAVVEARRFTYTDIFRDVLPRDDEH